MEINFARHQLVSLAAALVGVTQKRPGRMRRRLDINTTPIEPKTERCCSRRQQFRHYCGSSGRRNNRQNRSCRRLQPRCFGFYRCHVDVLQSQFSRNTISFAEFNVSTWYFFFIRFSLDPTFCGILVCGPLQLMFIEFQLLPNRIFRKRFVNSKQY